MELNTFKTEIAQKSEAALVGALRASFGARGRIRMADFDVQRVLQELQAVYFR